MRKPCAALFLLAASLSPLCGATELPAPAGTPVEFERDIRPVFETRCVSCHGPEKQKAGFRLDVKADALRGGDSGPAFTPGDSANSRLIQYVAGVDPEVVMPPQGERLTPEQVGLLRAWIDQGATWPDSPHAPPAVVESGHWAFRAPVRSAPPTPQDAARVRNAIDCYVLAKLEELGLQPSPEADRPTLIRRLSLDLTGLPPTPAEVDAFVNDTSPYAYESLVNRLLASPHFGEQWGRYWLDLARYADSDGFEKDTVRPYAWRYRDWVIDALNRDLPYDQFIIEQLAGDLLPNATLDQKVATGFHRNTLTNKEGGVDPEQFRVEQVVDRTNTTGAALLGVTIGCAQCHTHKYDPFTHREYYQLFAFFNTSVEKDIPAPRDEETQAYHEAKARFDQEHAKYQKAIDDYRPELTARLPEWESQQPVSTLQWANLSPTSYSAAGGSVLTPQADASLLVSGNAPLRDTYTVVAVTDAVGVTGVRLEALTDPSLPKTGPGRSENGNFVLSEITVHAAPLNDPTTGKAFPIRQAWADFAQEGFGAAAAFDGKPETGWAVGAPEGANAARNVEFILQEPAGFPGGTIFTITLDQRHGMAHNLGRFRLSVTTADAAVLAIPGNVREVIATPADKRSDEQKNALLDHFGTLDPKMRELKAALDGHAGAAPVPPATLAQALEANPEPPKTHIHIRGDFLQKGEEVQPGVPAVLPPLKPRGEVPDRLDLARWIASPENPLTGRVAVNRIWQHLFGRGLVETSEDFGTRGDPPSHPELLDWLATEFPARGWSTKSMIRLIVESATYRQSSVNRPELLERDPKNMWLARQSRLRMPAENIRDLFLATSGLLNPAVGGPSVRPPLPAGVADLGYAGSVTWPESQGEERYRRGLYIFFQRTVPYPMLMTFDCPDSNVTSVRRARSNTPLQALTLLNDPVFFECAQTFAQKILKEAPADVPARIRLAFRAATAREPSEAELKELTALLEDQRRIYDSVPETAGQSETAAYVALARVVLNLDEFITRE